MWKNNDDLSQLMSSPQAKAIAGMLRGMDPELLKKAAALATSGDAAGAQAMLMGDEKLRAMMAQMEEKDGGA